MRCLTVQKTIIKRKKIRNIYKKIYTVYYLNSILNKTFLGCVDLDEIELSTLSELNDYFLNSLRKEVIKMIPPQ